VKNLKAKKFLGQHFLNNQDIASKIVDSLTALDEDYVIEVGPGMGILSQFLEKRYKYCYYVEIDTDAIDYLNNKFPHLTNQIIHDDFLKINVEDIYEGKLFLIGNFPYNISSQILFKVLENKDKIIEIVGMFQKEVAERVISNPGSRVYGILSVFIQAYYNTEKIMDIGPEFFSPPPKVNSTVIRLIRNSTATLDCDERLFYKVVKSTFNQRRKMIRNSIKLLGVADDFKSEYLTTRPEQLGVAQFVELTNQIYRYLEEKQFDK
jgi:16S rRNA (adenine1518-N6/adenine1519-N6)-dimethyltransferase